MDNLEKKVKTKKKTYSKEVADFSDQELADQMEEEWEIIDKREDIDNMEKMKLIILKYNEKKNKKKLRQNKDWQDGVNKFKSTIGSNNIQIDYEKHFDDKEPGEIVETVQPKEHERLSSANSTINFIKPLILTRAKLQDLLNLPRFEEMIKGCFIRYHCSKVNGYSIAQIISTIQSNSKTYRLGKIQTNLLLRLQISTNQIQNLSMEIVSNQQVHGSLEINKWLDANRDKLPTINDLIRKKEELQKDSITQISTEQINRNIMRNIQKIVKKQKQIREDLSSYLSFLSEREHHIEVQLRDLQEGTHDFEVRQRDRQRRGRFSRETGFQKPKITQSKEELLSEKRKISGYLQKLKQLRQSQLQKKQEKKEIIKPKVQKLYDTRVARQDAIVFLIKERMQELGMASEIGRVYNQIIEDHKSHPLNISLKL